MPNDPRGSGKKPGRVQVFYFPKQRGSRPASDSRADTAIIPEFRPDAGRDDDLVTEPHYVVGERAGAKGRSSEGRATPPWPRRKTPKQTGRSSAEAKGPKDGKRRASRKKTPAVETNPALRVEAERARKPPLPQKGRPSRKALSSSQQVAERSVFGHRLFELGRLQEARAVFEGLVELELEDSFPHTMLGTIYLALGTQDRALALFEAALELDRDDLAALVYRGEIRLNRGKLKLALGDLNRALELGTGDDPFVERARRLIRMAQELAKRRRSSD